MTLTSAPSHSLRSTPSLGFCALISGLPRIARQLPLPAPSGAEFTTTAVIPGLRPVGWVAGGVVGAGETVVDGLVVTVAEGTVVVGSEELAVPASPQNGQPRRPCSAASANDGPGTGQFAFHPSWKIDRLPNISKYCVV